MRKTLLAIIAAVLVSGCSAPQTRVVEDFNFDWTFTLGDSPEFSAVSFDDSGWRALHLPHDWAVEGEFSLDNPSKPAGGALPGGIGWYRKHFVTPEGVGEGRRCFIEFDGIFMNSTIYVNGKEIYSRPYGYSSFSCDVTDALNSPGEDNLIAVRCDNADQPNSRWYAGCGIYRNTRLVTTSGNYVKYNGLFVSTPEVSAEKAAVHVEAEVCCSPESSVNFKILDAKGAKVAFAQGVKSAEGLFVADMEVPAPHLWDICDTYQYSVVAYVVKGNEICDAYPQKFGVRTTAWDKDKGFFLNGRNVKMQGVCLHHDMGCLGSAVHIRALQRELQILKDMGVNAIRTSHNPPAPELLYLADDMGFLVLDEAFDMWRKPKTRFDYSRFFDEWHEKDLSDFVKRDRNHPSVVFWSIGNEIPEQWEADDDLFGDMPVEEVNIMMNFLSDIISAPKSDDNASALLTEHLVKIVKGLDPTRPVTAGSNEVKPSNNLFKSGALDVYGFNYHVAYYDSVKTWYPDKPLFCSETASSINSRGVYFQPSTNLAVGSGINDGVDVDGFHDHQCSAYDASRVPWGELHEESWLAIKARDYLAGTFVWTGFDYIGEPTPYWWPSRSSYFGIVDLAGFPKAPYYMYQSEWTDKTVLHVLPHWNWSEGDEIDVWAYYSNADEVELTVNGKSMGRKSKTEDCLHCVWEKVPYKAGYIEAVSYKDGKEVARERRETTGEPVALKLTADRDIINADGYDLSYITVTAVDAQGREVPTADGMLTFSVSGDGELIGIDNGNAADTMCMKGTEKALFSGKALAVVRSLRNKRGSSVLTVSGYGSTASIPIRTK